MGSLKHAGRPLRSVIVGLAAACGTAAGAWIGFLVAPALFDGADFGETVVARFLEAVADVVIAGWIAAAGGILFWVLAPLAVRAMAHWPYQGKTLALQLAGGVVLWPALAFIATIASDLPSLVLMALALMAVFAVSAFTEAYALGRAD